MKKKPFLISLLLSTVVLFSCAQSNTESSNSNGDSISNTSSSYSGYYYEKESPLMQEIDLVENFGDNWEFVLTQPIYDMEAEKYTIQSRSTTQSYFDGKPKYISFIVAVTNEHFFSVITCEHKNNHDVYERKDYYGEAFSYEIKANIPMEQMRVKDRNEYCIAHNLCLIEGRVKIELFTFSEETNLQPIISSGFDNMLTSPGHDNKFQYFYLSADFEKKLLSIRFLFYNDGPEKEVSDIYTREDNINFIFISSTFNEYSRIYEPIKQKILL